MKEGHFHTACYLARGLDFFPILQVSTLSESSEDEKMTLLEYPAVELVVVLEEDCLGLDSGDLDLVKLEKSKFLGSIFDEKLNEVAQKQASSIERIDLIRDLRQALTDEVGYFSADLWPLLDNDEIETPHLDIS